MPTYICSCGMIEDHHGTAQCSECGKSMRLVACERNAWPVSQPRKAKSMSAIDLITERIAALKIKQSRTLSGDLSTAYQDEITFLEPVLTHLVEVRSLAKSIVELHEKRLKVAEDRYNKHEFEFPVIACNGWEICANVHSRVVFLDNGSGDSIKQTFTVTFIPHTDIVVE